MAVACAARVQRYPGNFGFALKRYQAATPAEHARLIGQAREEFAAGRLAGAASVAETVAASNFDPLIVAAARAAFNPLLTQPLRAVESDRDFRPLGFTRRPSSFMLGPFFELLPAASGPRFFGRIFSGPGWQYYYDEIKAAQVLTCFSDPANAARFLRRIPFSGSATSDFVLRGAERSVVWSYAFRRFEIGELISAYAALV